MTADILAARALADAADKAAEGATTWEPINTAPRDGEWFIARTAHGQTRVVHYADEYDCLPVSHDGVCWHTEPIEWTAVAPVLSIATDTASRDLLPDMAATIRALADEVERLREALRFYSCKDECNACSENERDLSDCGWTARAALFIAAEGRHE